MKNNRNISDIVSMMTLEEKVEQINIGKPHMYQGNVNERLGIPALYCTDGPKGPRTKVGEVCYPIALAQAATWDKELMYKTGKEFAEQLKYNGKNQLYGPGVNMVMNPLAGRNSEYYGEDPVLSGKIAASVCKALHEEKIIATLKHFAVNDFETGRTKINVNLSERVLNELFLLPFKIGIQEGCAKSVMTTYNSVNGHYTANNRQILDALYSWGFKGIVVSDWAANLENVGESLSNGSHIEIHGHNYYSLENVKAALSDGTLTEEMLNLRVTEIIGAKFTCFDINERPTGEEDVEKHRRLAHELGCASVVLLKNKANLLPLSKDISVALIGPMADSELIIGNQGSSTIWQEYCITPLDALKKNNIKFEYAKGCDVLDYGTSKENEFICTARYYNNLKLEGEPVIIRQERQIQKRSFSKNLTLGEGILNNCYCFNSNLDLKLGIIEKETIFSGCMISLWLFYNEQFAAENQPFMIFVSRKNGSFIEFSPVGLMLNDKKILEYQLPTCRWTHFIFSCAEGKACVYIDGNRISEIQIPNLGEQEIYIGGNFEKNRYANCKIDEFSAISSNDEDLIKLLGSLKLPVEGLLIYDACDIAPVILNENYEGIIDVTKFSASWEGKFIPQKTSKYLFSISSNGGIRFYFNGECLCDQFEKGTTKGEGEDRRIWLDVKSGNEYDIKIEMKSVDDDTHISFDCYSLDYENLFSDAITAAKKCDVAVVMVGVHQQAMQGEANDNETYKLPGYQNELILAVSEVNPNTIVLMSTSGGAEVYEFINNIAALAEIFYPGQEAGKIVYSLLFGDATPTGRLPVTYPQTLKQLKYETVLLEYPDELDFFGYRYFDSHGIEPQYEFGYGLSYSSFEYKDISCSLTDDNSIYLEGKVVNVGRYDDSQVFQLYISNKTSRDRPKKELKDFCKKFIKRGETIKFNFISEPLWFEIFHDGGFIVQDGEYELMIGISSRKILYSRCFEIKSGKIALL